MTLPKLKLNGPFQLPARWPDKMALMVGPVFIANTAPSLSYFKPVTVMNVRLNGSATLQQFKWPVAINDLYPTKLEAINATVQKFDDRIRRLNVRIAKAILERDDAVQRATKMCEREGLPPFVPSTLNYSDLEQLKYLVAADKESEPNEWNEDSL